MNLDFSRRGRKQLDYWNAYNPKMARKIVALIEDIMDHPYAGAGKPEPLKHELSGYWSRRIDAEHRLVYQVKDDTLFILSCRYHYPEA